ncbi:uncharacterized protein OCT59_026537 [Rhizophagus irregularis]|uniref:Outer arm dynein light chain 1 n=2 Tax=Rhizophagus irregularis TaxID=588596 RepID=A0A015LH90_RHIIW|nr:hypothetical protein GLOIN_2v1764589 [Rhizophagus irregularis DAOM 181602=DAOM 197198]EXX71991.1 hypothetical protein RirG_073560 [Rhizophagus irregularis DAOM 197198w]UZO06206.1 hypothetical protein OCT59_026537 [Rhizophagus irregularis]POG80460.1 hypothetical protein GLOIN_2v1764589 [Rhizophagus irregularis DAOM 181602=DAOM 197198]CAG8590914.1 19066_t:CDS:1 [Rhizophagus irregularis]GBC16736.1 T9SS type A sorting domain-containing protein [Rhizophagus irregularis DAOM 181602=DAOM 197198]|eukprot:XP_025187326.1 hypothetical protein GLOIN_2v1764589 [Rhizophagus irregularis DAOM 181602=DAOM 197198]
MVKAQEWLDRKYPTAEAKAKVKRIGPKQDLKSVGSNLLSSFIKGRSLSAVLDNEINNSGIIESNLSLEGPLSLKGFINLEFLNICNHKITTLDVSDCLQLRELRCSDNKLTNIDLTGLDKIEKIFCDGCQLTNLEFLKTLNPVRLVTLRMNNNKFPAQDLSCFTPFINLERLYIVNNPFYGSLKPLRDLTYLKEIGIAGTDIDSGLEYLPENFFNLDAAASYLGLVGGHFKRLLICTGKLAEQLNNYKIENDPLKNYDWQAWKRDNQELIDKAKKQDKQEELTELLEWEVVG